MGRAQRGGGAGGQGGWGGGWEGQQQGRGHVLRKEGAGSKEQIEASFCELRDVCVGVCENTKTPMRSPVGIPAILEPTPPPRADAMEPSRSRLDGARR